MLASQAVELLPRHDDFIIGAKYMARLPDAGYTRDVGGEEPFWQSGPRKAQTFSSTAECKAQTC